VLNDADRGGFTFAPEVGVHEGVHELDFASLYPAIIRTRNVSPETVRCDCHPDREDVPGLGYAVCPDDGYLPDVLGPIIDDRAAMKETIAASDDAADVAALEAKASALKWILVACFGYQGFANAKFGRIECHEAINAFAREILLDAKDALEAAGWRVVHGIVDSLWVQADPDRAQRPLDGVAAGVTDDVGIPLEHEAEYDWIAFCPRRDGAGGALTRHFGHRAGAPVADDEGYTYRGIETRQRSTPPHVAAVQRALVQTYGQTRAPEAVLDRLRRELARLAGGDVDPERLAVTNRVSRPREAYERATRNAAALDRAADRDRVPALGQDVRYVVVDDDRDSRDRVALLSEEPARYDASFYRERLVRAATSVLSPLGWSREDVDAALADRTDATLAAFGDE
jgi:DNA polymerase I